ncbi:MAG: ATP-binding protein [Bacteroidales bacterium]|jgi:predicted AAA+ superfamily ATPase|nr:ATP-binding protein [Bacteroidales bacterium]MCK9497999.1 ATP-binding protein [Bacteroidales bacterium]MDY0314727.1 ATP-binding protein [Bacteroidales bacterium]NLB86559.1 ATP-binding protein [Bacteroidales bacterium]
MLTRDLYIDSILPFVDKPQVKVLTGIRRSGKSVILDLLIDELKKRGIIDKQILRMNFESFQFSEFTNSVDFYKYVKSKILLGKRNYLFFDEIQEVKNWEKAVNSFLVDFDVDIYITGSNSKLLSSELATFLAGRYVEIPIYTLSFKEFLQFKSKYLQNINIENDFIYYLKMGGFPGVHVANYSQEAAYKVIYDIYSSVILRDTVQRFGIRDIELLERLIKYLFDNVGCTFSGKNIADYFKSQHRKVDINTIYNYLSALESAFIVYRVSRFDIQGKEILKTQEKFYVSDISIIHAVMGFKNRMISQLLENLVFLELKRRGYKVYIGKLGNLEIDFVAEKTSEKIYVQVAYKLENPETAKREFANLLKIKDQYPKYVVSMDEFWTENVEGVKHLHISDFLKL